MTRASTLTAAAGEHYVCYALSCLGYISALVREGSPTVDLLASNVTGSRTVAIQVKTTVHAVRKRGPRNGEKVPFELQFPMGAKAIETAAPGLIFCLVDLRGFKPETPPDVYVVPADVFIEHYAGKNIRKHAWFRLHWPIERLAPFKNNWQPLHDALAADDPGCAKPEEHPESRVPESEFAPSN